MNYILDEKEIGNDSETVEDRLSKKAPVKEREPEDHQDENPLESRVTELEGALKAEENKSVDLLRRLQYLQADFENYRKRVEREMGDAKRFGNERLLSDLLTVKDELELAFVKAQESKQNPVIIDGVGMTLKRLQALLSKEGVERVPGVGSKFNPEYQEAALRVPSEEQEGTVVEEVRAGYMLKGRVLRPSIVKVAEKAPVQEIENGEESKNE